jgi:hypothetical protein
VATFAASEIITRSNTTDAAAADVHPGQVRWLISGALCMVLLIQPGPSVREQWVKWEDHASPGQEGSSTASLLYLADGFRPLPEAYGLQGSWFPTLSYGLEIKKAPPTEKGWEWLYVRAEMCVVKNGRFYLTVMILDEEEELVAMGNHTALIVPASRGPAKGSKAVGSKI